MVEAGVMDGVDYVIGLHVMSGLESGKIGHCVWADDGGTRRIYSFKRKGGGGRGRRETIAIAISAKIYNILYQEIRHKESFQLRSFMGNG